MPENKKQKVAMQQVNSRLEEFLKEKTAGKAKNKRVQERNFAECLRIVPVLPSQKELDEVYLHEVMRRAAGSQIRAAEIMGITPQALCSRLKKYEKYCKNK